jgi:hypothetical protein
VFPSLAVSAQRRVPPNRFASDARLGDAARSQGGLSAEQVGMRAGARELDLITIVAVNQDPIALNVTAPIAVPRTLQRVIVLNRRELLSLTKGVDYRLELVETIASALYRPEILFELP